MTTQINDTVIEKIKTYIETNDLSLKKIAEAAGIGYYSLWSMLNRNQTIKLDDYVALCRAFKEPLDKFIPK